MATIGSCKGPSCGRVYFVEGCSGQSAVWLGPQWVLVSSSLRPGETRKASQLCHRCGEELTSPKVRAGLWLAARRGPSTLGILSQSQSPQHGFW